jgi:hypothetical protein
MKKLFLKWSTVVSVFTSIFIASPAFAIAQEGTSEPGEGLTAVETALYFFVAPFGLFLAIVVLAYAVHRPREKRTFVGHSLSEIR